jgi:translation elongation factor EF-1alpha
MTVVVLGDVENGKDVAIGELLFRSVRIVIEGKESKFEEYSTT